MSEILLSDDMLSDDMGRRVEGEGRGQPGADAGPVNAMAAA